MACLTEWAKWMDTVVAGLDFDMAGPDAEQPGRAAALRRRSHADPAVGLSRRPGAQLGATRRRIA